MTNRLTFAQLASDAVTDFCGSWAFIFISSGVTLAWVMVNIGLFAFGNFDPYPFIFFNLIWTVIEGLQGPLIMMSQNRQTERDREAVQGLHTKLDELAARL